jgi:hypothetical protein
MSIEAKLADGTITSRLEAADVKRKVLEHEPAEPTTGRDTGAGIEARAGSVARRKSKHGHTWPPPRARVDTHNYDS